jgi:SAM-dependent methyltransferase
VLEVGCGTGRISTYLRAALDWTVTGIEPNPDAAAAAREAGLDVHIGTLEDYDGDGLFDIVIVIHVLEHLTNPAASMKKIHELLREGGKLVVAVPNAGSVERKLFGKYWDGWDIPRHVYHYEPGSLTELLARSGFAPGPVGFECYSLLGRSLANKFFGYLEFNDRKYRLRNRWLERIWGTLLAMLKGSSAIQVVAVWRE